MRLSAFAIAIVLAAPVAAFANPALLAEVKAADAAYWNAYNACDYATLDKLTAEDVEFYHDVGGITRGRAALTDSVRRNICGNPDLAVRRNASESETQAFLLQRGPEVYGALLSGQHHFTNTPKGQTPVPGSDARFSMLWLRKDGGWQLSRVVSYDHRAAAHTNTRTAIELAPAELDRFVGSYAARMQPVLTFTRAGGNLSVEVGGRAMTLYPMNRNTFFLKERDIEVEFAPGGDKAPGFVVREHGRPVDEGKRM